VVGNVIVFWQLLSDVTVSITEKFPAALNVWQGACAEEVLAAPLAGSPKIQLQPVIEPGDGTCDELVKQV